MNDKVKKAIELNKRHARIYISVIKETEQEIIIKAEQKRNPNGNYATLKQLVSATKSVFEPFTEKKIIVRPYPYKKSPPEVVTPQWINERMKQYGIGQKTLVERLGINKSDISAMINGHKSIGGRTKAAFFYFFKTIGLEK